MRQSALSRRAIIVVLPPKFDEMAEENTVRQHSRRTLNLWFD